MMTLKRHRNGVGATIAEFGPALFVFFLFILFPLVNLIAMGTGAATVYLTAKQTAVKAADSTTFGQGLLAAEDRAYEIESGGFGDFSKMNPIGGFNGSGVDIYVIETNIATNVSTRNGPNTPFVTNPVNTDTYLYSYESVATFEIGPFMEMGGVPFIGNIPGIGVPAQLTYTASENVEHPEGLSTGIPSGEIPPNRSHKNNHNTNHTLI